MNPSFLKAYIIYVCFKWWNVTSFRCVQLCGLVTAQTCLAKVVIWSWNTYQTMRPSVVLPLPERRGTSISLRRSAGMEGESVRVCTPFRLSIKIAYPQRCWWPVISCLSFPSGCLFRPLGISSTVQQKLWVQELTCFTSTSWMCRQCFGLCRFWDQRIHEPFLTELVECRIRVGVTGLVVKYESLSRTLFFYFFFLVIWSIYKRKLWETWRPQVLTHVG